VIAELRDASRSLRQIAAELTHRDIQTARGGGAWTAAAAQRVLLRVAARHPVVWSQVRLPHAQCSHVGWPDERAGQYRKRSNLRWLIALIGPSRRGSLSPKGEARGGIGGGGLSPSTWAAGAAGASPDRRRSAFYDVEVVRAGGSGPVPVLRSRASTMWPK
jgi:hypothetical protein